MLYAVWRFGNEFLRADSGPWRPTAFGRTLELGPLTVFQWMSLALLAAFAAAYLAARRAGRAPFAPPAAAPEEKRCQTP
jgi:prolipoprotein diacylglyceryltransferase